MPGNYLDLTPEPTIGASLLTSSSDSNTAFSVLQAEGVFIDLTKCMGVLLRSVPLIAAYPLSHRIWESLRPLLVHPQHHPAGRLTALLDLASALIEAAPEESFWWVHANLKSQWSPTSQWAPTQSSLSVLDYKYDEVRSRPPSGCALFRVAEFFHAED